MLSDLERMKQLFPTCPICKSNEGYEYSAFIPDVKCKWCGAEWSLYEDGMELKRASGREWDKRLLNKRIPFADWKRIEPKIIVPQIREKIFAPMDYVGGHLDYRKPAIGYIMFKPEGVTYRSSEGSINKMELKIPVEKLREMEIKTIKEITFERWFLMGAWSILFKAKKELLVLSYEDETEMIQHVVFDFRGQRKNGEELIDLVSYLKKKAVDNKPSI